MGTEYYLVDKTGRHALDIHKSYWLAYADAVDVGDEFGPQSITVAKVRAALAQRRADPVAQQVWEFLPPIIIEWLETVAEGDVVIASEHDWIDGFSLERVVDWVPDGWDRRSPWGNSAHPEEGWTWWRTGPLAAVAAEIAG